MLPFVLTTFAGSIKLFARIMKAWTLELCGRLSLDCIVVESAYIDINAVWTLVLAGMLITVRNNNDI